MRKGPSSHDIARGKRLSLFLEKRFPHMSWRARSATLGFPDTTVIGWRQGREISNDGIARLLELGCDIMHLVTGEKNVKEDPSTIAGIFRDSRLTIAFTAASTIRRHLDKAQEDVLEGRLTVDDYIALIQAVLKGTQEAETLLRKNHKKSSDSDRHDVGA